MTCCEVPRGTKALFLIKLNKLMVSAIRILFNFCAKNCFLHLSVQVGTISKHDGKTLGFVAVFIALAMMQLQPINDKLSFQITPALPGSMLV